MKEKIPTMEGGRMGREGNTVWAWLGKAHWGRSLPPSIQGFEPPSVPRKTLPAPGLPDGSAEQNPRILLGRGPRWERNSSGSQPQPADIHLLLGMEEAALEPPSPVLADGGSGLWAVWSMSFCRGSCWGLESVTPNTSL